MVVVVIVAAAAAAAGRVQLMQHHYQSCSGVPLLRMVLRLSWEVESRLLQQLLAPERSEVQTQVFRSNASVQLGVCGCDGGRLHVRKLHPADHAANVTR